MKHKRKIAYLAKHDILTGISNRLYFEEQLQTLISSSGRNRKKFAMLFLDLDHFKEINDMLGHDIRDKLLQKVVEQIRQNIRNEDIFARIGGDEFIIVLTNIKETDLIVTLHKVIDLIHQPWSIEKFELDISASIGFLCTLKMAQQPLNS